ncbi:MAG TPA: lysophospholipid acyltransferase family protein [Mycobacteriales bacterium]|nr:lysophospholipid acyltransferase family protein [Mycobacteriales bacterium]
MTATGRALRETTQLRLLRAAFRILLRLAFRLRVIGADLIPAEGPVLLAGNHTGFLDGPFVFIESPRPAAFLVKSELYTNRWLGRLLSSFRQIPVHRGRPDRTALRSGLAVLAAGGVLGVFPEGTRGTGMLESVQHGIGYLALKSACPIVPVVCLGTADALPRGHRLPRLRVPIDIVFGTPFRVEPTGDPRARSTVAAAAEQIRRQLLDHLDRSLPLTGRTPPR